MFSDLSKRSRRMLIISNYLSLIIMEILYYFALIRSNLPHFFDFIGIFMLIITGVTFVYVYVKTGLWKLTHSKTDKLDERQIELTHRALSKSYALFAVLCLSIMMIHATLYRLLPENFFIITMPLVAGLIYCSHILPASIIAWGDEKL